MTEAVFYKDSYLTELQATIVAVTKNVIELDRTIFYPTGGGQPGDTGWIETSSGKRLIVSDTRKGQTHGTILHHLAVEDHDLQPGDVVKTGIDWQRRYSHMQMHTSMHLLGSLVPVPVTGGSVGAEKSRLDFDLGDQKLDKEELTRQMNELIDAAHDIVFESITEDELDAKPELVRTMSVQPPRGVGDIRMVRVKDVDFQPCGGTHINNTSEIGPMRVSKIENKGKRNRRIHLVFD
ncbi:MAG: alanyl-tRNA editing protein [Gammaproteobacteria bacterium]|nr:alanyl-tRNA editing protein [Gammaproteobacteria bacterium]